MNEKIRHALYLALIAGFVVAVDCCFIFFLGGCASARADASGTVLEHQREVARLEETVKRYDATVANAIAELGDLTSRSAGMEGDIDEIIRLFGAYKSRVDQLLRDLDALRGTAADAGEDNSGVGDNNFD